MAITHLDRAIEANDLQKVISLVEAGADLRQLGDYDGTPLANAAALGHAEIVKYLLEAGADPLCGGCRSVLVTACGRGHLEVCKELLKGGADPNEIYDDEESTCLSLAIFKAHLDIVRLLIEHGADPEPLDEKIEYATELNSNGSHDAIIAYLHQLQQSGQADLQSPSE